MSTELWVISALLALGAGGWLWSRRLAARKRPGQAEEDPLERHDHARAHEMAKIQAELSRWSGPH